MNPEQPSQESDLTLLEKRQRELEADNERLREELRRQTELATKDLLTGIYNRRGFTEEFERLKGLAIRHGGEIKFSIALADIDNFKSINDTYGHKVGDEVIKHVANVLSEALRGSDIVARWGGEEFIIAFPDTNEQEAAIAAELKREKLEETVLEINGRPLPVKISMGVAGAHGPEQLEELVMQADGALYKAKAAGKNQVKRAGEVESS